MPLAALLIILAACGMVQDWRETWLALVTVPAVLWGPGRGWAVRLGAVGWRREFDACWIAAILAIASLFIARMTGTGGAGVLAGSLTWSALGAARVRPTRAVAERGSWVPLVGMAALLATAWAWRGDIARPLDRYWWFAAVENGMDETAVAPTPGFGWATTENFADDGATALKLTPKQADPYLLGPNRGDILFVLRGPVGATLKIDRRTIRVDASPVESVSEGKVRRYLDRGVVSTIFSRQLDGGERLDLVLSHPEASVVYVLARPDAVWSLDGAGELKFAHYFQLLNMVEQIDWARNRWVTDVQPPLWTPILGAAVAVTGGDLPTANILFFAVLLLGVLAGVRFLNAHAPDAPALAWLLPVAAAVVHAKLMLSPASAAMPDTLYSVAIVAALAGPVVGFGLAAQLARYPGGAVVLVGAILAGKPRTAVMLCAVIVLAALAFAAGGALSGSLPGWLNTVAWEGGPEHWHGNYSASDLLSRVPEFYRTWVIYAGGAPLLAALAWPRGTRIALGAALVYSVLLCTIDHSPTHYFLPLLHLSTLALACTSATFRNPLMRHGLPLAGLAGLSTFYLHGSIH